MAISRSPYLLYIASFFATICLYYGLNAIVRPQNAMEIFQFPYPTDSTSRKLIDNLMIIYGIRDVFMAFGIYIAAYSRHRIITGFLLIFVCMVAVADGFANKAVVGTGEWTHWGYAPVCGVIGLLLTGVVDS